MNHRPIALAPLVLAFLAAPGHALQQCQHQKLLPPDGGPNTQMGWSAAVSGDTAVLGARFDGGAGDGAGAAYVWERGPGGWSFAQKLVASDADPHDAFGFSVAIDGDVIVVGANRDEAGAPSSGSAFVFERSGGVWSEVAKLVPPVPETGANAGESVAVHGATAVVGVHFADDVPPHEGVAHVYERVAGTWTFVQELKASDAAVLDHFGLSLALEGGTLLVGARNHPEAGVDAGAAYVFERRSSAFVEVQRILAADAAPGAFFGAAVGLAGDLALVGAPLESSAAPQAGAVYAFERVLGSFVQAQKITASDAAPADWFGDSLDLGQTHAVVAAHLSDAGAPDGGAAYLLERSGGAWVESAQFVATDAAALDVLGTGVALAGESVLVGAPRDGDVAPRSGAAYVFSVDGSPVAGLIGSTGSLSLAAGGAHELELATCAEHAGALYAVLGSTSGTRPGIDFGGVHLPLQVDPYFLFTVNSPSTPPLSSSLGPLGPLGAASATFTLPPGLDPALAGLTVHHAALTLDLSGGVLFLAASNPVPLSLVP